MDFYSFSIAASKHVAHGTAFQHSSGLIVANSVAEAIGKATQQANAQFPVSEGWANHSAAVEFQTEFIASKITGVLVNGGK